MMNLQVNKCYQFKRITGKIIRMKLLSFTNPDSRVEMYEHNGGGLLNLDKLTPEEIESMTEINCENE